MRATNWVGDAVMSLPALRALRERFLDERTKAPQLFVNFAPFILDRC